MNGKRTLFVFVAVLLIAAQLLAACGATATPTAAPTVAPTKAPATSAPATTPPTAVPPTAAPTKVPPTATAVPPTPTKAPAVGGTAVWLQGLEPDTLDSAVTMAGAYSSAIINMLGATLVARDPSGAFVPYLAESWKTSSDGLTWEFKLRKGIKFHDGAPVTAADFAWTYARVLDPATKSVGAKAMLAQLDKVVAVDDLTLQLKLKAPYYPMLVNLIEGVLQPQEKAAVEKGGTGYGRSPVGVGPYKIKEWVTGSKVVLERNPDYTWAPPFAHQGPAYIQTVEFRIVTDSSTQLAGVEAGELDLGSVQAKDLTRFQDAKKFQIFKAPIQGISPFFVFNVSKPPFDDIKVRQAINMALDREAMIKVMLQGNGIVQYGPLSPSVSGYWAGVEKIGYKLDLAKAKDLMKQAGYVAGADGMLSKDGKPYKLNLMTLAGSEVYIKIAQIAQEQVKAIGLDVEIQQQEGGVAIGKLLKGDYEISAFGMTYPDAELMYLMFHSSQVGGGYNVSQLKDPALDKFLELTRTETDPAKRQAACDAAQQLIVEKAYVAPLYIPLSYWVMSARIKGVVFSEKTITTYMYDAYIESK